MTIASPFAVILLVVALGLIWWTVGLYRTRLGFGGLSTRGTLLVAFVGFEFLLVSVTEILSVGNHLSERNTIIAWFAIDAVLAAVLVSTAGIEPLRSGVRTLPSTTLKRAREAQPVVLITLTAVAVIVVGVLAMASLYLPNNGDSLVYHLARVSHWIQQSSAHHFATHNTAQIEFAPLHEFNMLHIQLLGGGDRLVNFAQVFGFVVCIVGASELARLLGASIEAQAGASLIFAVVPSAVLQAAGTQNDVFSAAVAVSVLVVLLSWQPGQRAWLGPALVFAVAIGLAAIVKGGVPLLIGPAVVLLVARIFLLERTASSPAKVLRWSLAIVGVIVVCIAVVAGPHLWRNYRVFNTFTGPISESAINEEFLARGAAGNIIRSVAVNFRFGDGSSGIDTVVQRAVLGISREFYELIGASQDDQRFVIGALDDAFTFGNYDYYSRTEEFGANGWHVILIVVTTVLFTVWAIRGDRRSRLPCLLIVGLFIGFIAFSASARWSLFVSRYQLALLAPWSALISIALSRVHRFLLRAVLTFLFFAVMPQLLDNSARSLVHPQVDWPSDIHAYFVHAGGDGFFVAPEDYVAARDAIASSRCDRLGIGNWILLEYPIWAGLRNAGWDGHIEDVSVQNESSVLEDKSFEPCAIIRQSVFRPVAPRAGWTDVPFGDLTVSFAPGFGPTG